MAEVGAVAGTKLYIGGYASVPLSSDWVEIKEIRNLGDQGTSFSKIARESLGDGYTRQIKGTESAPTLSVEMNRDDDDPGQVALRAAAADRNNFYNFKIVDNDGTVIQFKGRMFGFVRGYGGVNALKTIKGDIEVEPDSTTITYA